MNNVI